MPRKGQRLIPDSHRKKNQINVRLNDWEMATLKRIAKEQGLPASYLVREALRLFFGRYSRS